MENVGDFYLSGSGADQSFMVRFGDNAMDRRIHQMPQMMWWASQYNKPEYAWWEVQNVDRGYEWRVPTHVWDIIWYEPELLKGFDPSAMEKDYCFNGVDLTSMRSSWADDAVIIAMKGSDGKNPDNPHSSVDTGTFFLDALREDWTVQLGWEDYSKGGLFSGNYTSSSPGYAYYRKCAEGHNTLLVNPDTAKSIADQNVPGKTQILAYETSETDTFSVTDLSVAYKDYVDNVESVKRGIRLFNDR